MSKHIIQKLYKVNDGTDTNYMKAYLYYSLGGCNMFTYKNEPRGYYVSIGPVKRWVSDGVQMESFTAFTGYKWLAKEVTRQSKAAEKSAITFFNAMHKTFIKQAFPDMEINYEEVKE